MGVPSPSPIPQTGQGHRSTYALIASVSALGLVIGVLGFLVMTPDAATMSKQDVQGFSTGMSKSFAAPATLASNQIIADPRMSSPTMAQKKAAKNTPKPGFYDSKKDNIMTQKSGFGSWLQKFQSLDKNSKYGVPIFNDDGNINPAYLAAERKELAAKKKQNIAAAETKRKGLIAKKDFTIMDYIRKKVGSATEKKNTL